MCTFLTSVNTSFAHCSLYSYLNDLYPLSSVSWQNVQVGTLIPSNIIFLISFISGELKYSNGDYYKGSFKDGYPHGKGKMFWANGDYYEGNWDNGKPKGYGKKLFTLDNGDKYEGEYDLLKIKQAHSKIVLSDHGKDSKNH